MAPGSSTLDAKTGRRRAGIAKDRVSALGAGLVSREYPSLGEGCGEGGGAHRCVGAAFDLTQAIVYDIVMRHFGVSMLVTRYNG